MENRFFPEIRKNFGFGLMRLPMLEGKVDTGQVSRMIDLFMENGFNYFDTARPYIEGNSELAVKECISSRYDRSEFVLTNKLSGAFFKKEEDIRPLFESQLKACGVEYFDFYLMHAQNAKKLDHYKACRAYEIATGFREEGMIRHLGISFHDKPAVLDRILTEYPQIEIVQIQFNYVDYEDLSVESRKVYEICEKHNKPVLVMEPVKGGHLVELPDDCQAVFDSLQSADEKHTNAEYAIRFAAGFPQMAVVLSGMSNLEQMQDNIRFMKDFKPLSREERIAVDKVSAIFRSKEMIPCTACRYCVEENHCPKDILIPDVFSCLNKKHIFHNWNQDFYYNDVLTVKNGKASACVRCGGCEKVCPQHLPIRDLLAEAAKEFEHRE